MTVTLLKRSAPASDPYLYPGAPGLAADICERCFQHTDDLALTADRRITSPKGPLVRVCPACFRALAAGLPVALPTGDALTETWTGLARWAFNEEIERPIVDRALADLAPGLTADEAAEWFGELSDALLWQQEVEAPGYDMLLHEPEERDVDRLREASQERVTEALTALMAGAR